MEALDRDLRERILNAIKRGEPMPSVAAWFEVGYSTVKKLKDGSGTPARPSR